MINLHETLLALQYGRSTKVLIDFFRISNLQDLPSLIATYIPKGTYLFVKFDSYPKSDIMYWVLTYKVSKWKYEFTLTVTVSVDDNRELLVSYHLSFPLWLTSGTGWEGKFVIALSWSRSVFQKGNIGELFWDFWYWL